MIDNNEKKEVNEEIKKEHKQRVLDETFKVFIENLNRSLTNE